MAHILTNAELSVANHTKIIIPTVYREIYLGGLYKLTRYNKPEVYIRVLECASSFIHTLQGDDMVQIEAGLKASNTFKKK